MKKIDCLLAHLVSPPSKGFRIKRDLKTDITWNLYYQSLYFHQDKRNIIEEAYEKMYL